MEKIWKELIRKNIIIKARKLGKTETYRLNRENPRVKVLMKTALDLSRSYLESLKNKEFDKIRVAVPA